MSNFQPPPTWAELLLTDEKTGKATFNPIWLSWFIGLTQGVSASGATTADSLVGTTLAPNVVTSSLTRVGTLLSLAFISSAFESSEQTVPAADTTVTTAHSLGRLPKLWYVVLRCKTTEAGYAVDDELLLPATHDNFSAWANATSIGYRATTGANATFIVSNRLGIGNSTLTGANWKLVMRAW